MAQHERDFRKLLVWQKAHALVVRIYQETRSFPKEEQYGLTSQMRRAAVSIAANLAEGCGRRSESELARFMTIAQGSVSEVDYFLTLACDLNYWAEVLGNELGMLLDEVKRMLTAYIGRLREKP